MLIAPAGASASHVFAPVQVGDELWAAQRSVAWGDGLVPALVHLERDGTRQTYPLPAVSIDGDVQQLRARSLAARGEDELWLAVHSDSSVDGAWSSSALYTVDLAELNALPSGATVPSSALRLVAQAPRGDRDTYDLRALAAVGDDRLVAVRGAWPGPCSPARPSLVTMSSDGHAVSRLWPAQGKPTHFGALVRADRAGGAWLPFYMVEEVLACGDDGSATWRGGALLARLDPDGTVRSGPHQPGEPPAYAACDGSSELPTFAVGDDGAMWCSLGAGLARFASPTSRPETFRLPDTMAFEWDRVLAAGPDGSVWFTWRERSATTLVAAGDHQIGRLGKDGQLYRYPAAWAEAISNRYLDNDPYLIPDSLIAAPDGLWLARADRVHHHPNGVLRFISLREAAAHETVAERLPARDLANWWFDAPPPIAVPDPDRPGTGIGTPPVWDGQVPPARRTQPAPGRPARLTVRLGRVQPQRAAAFRRTRALRLPVQVSATADVTARVALAPAALRRLRIRAALGAPVSRRLRGLDGAATIAVPLPARVRRSIAGSRKPIRLVVGLIARDATRQARLRRVVTFAAAPDAPARRRRG